VLWCVESGLGLCDQRLGLGLGGAESQCRLKLREGGLRGVEAQVELAEGKERLRVAWLADGRLGQGGASGDQVVQGDVRG